MVVVVVVVQPLTFSRPRAAAGMEPHNSRKQYLETEAGYLVVGGGF